ncbi:MAG: hypothetical protein ACFFEV_10635, partial [Candidatus Thorarchaeota archaeon]
PQNSALNDNTWYNVQIGIDMDLSKIRGWKNNLYMGEVDFRNTAGVIPTNITGFASSAGTQIGRALSVDNVFIRKWVPLEPNHGEWEGTPIISWYHDCSNTTGFAFNDSWNMNWNAMDWTITGGTLSSDSSTLTITNVPTGTGYHGPVFEHELQSTFRVRDIQNFNALFDVDNSLSSYLGYQVVMLGDADRNPVIYFSFGDGWADYRQGAYGISYVFPNGSRVGYGSGYPITWTSFSGEMNVSYTESGLLGYVEGIGQGIITGLTEDDFNREIKYVAIASARFGSDPLFPVLVDELYLNHDISIDIEPMQPSITDVDDFSYEAGTSGNTIEWTVANFTPTSYMLWRDSGLLEYDVWPGGSAIEFYIDNLSPGEYNYTITVFGEGSIEVSDTAIVTVIDSEDPSLGHPIDITYEFGTVGHTIIWSVSDLYPDEYIIYKDGAYLEDGSWTSGFISIGTDGLALGEHNYTILVDDVSGNVAIDTVIVTVVDTTAPILNNPSDISGTLANTSIQITWQPTDLLPFFYEIYSNGSLVSSGTWTSGGNLTCTLEDLTAGVYNITIIVWDTSGNQAQDTVIITIQGYSIPSVGDIVVVTISLGSLGVIVVIIGLICRDKGKGPKARNPSSYDW